MSVQTAHSHDGQPPVFERHAEERYQERSPVANPIPLYDAYHQSLVAYIEDDCQARVFPEYDLIFVVRNEVVKTELVADYGRMKVPDAMWCDDCEKPFKPDIKCSHCGNVTEFSTGKISISYGEGQ